MVSLKLLLTSLLFAVWSVMVKVNVSCFMTYSKGEHARIQITDFADICCCKAIMNQVKEMPKAVPVRKKPFSAAPIKNIK